MSRHNFSTKTKEDLAASAGYRCVRPGCRKVTHTYNYGTGKFDSIGVIAHDSAAAPGGPRYDANLTYAQRTDFSNGANLCANCARLVDCDPERFPIGKISGWQMMAIQSTHQVMHLSNHQMNTDMLVACERGQKFARLSDKIQLSRSVDFIPQSTIYAVREFLALTANLNLTSQYSAQHPHLVEMQLEMIADLIQIKVKVETSNCWRYSNEHDGFYLEKTETIFPSPSQIIRNEEIVRSAKVVELSIKDYFDVKSNFEFIVYHKYPSQQ